MCIVIVSFLGCDVMNFEINFSFLIKPFSHMTKKVISYKNVNILRTKQAFFIIFKGFSLKKIKQTILEGECPTINFNLEFFTLDFIMIHRGGPRTAATTKIKELHLGFCISPRSASDPI